MTEQCGNRLEAHASVDRLGCKRVAELMRMNVSDAGSASGEGDNAMHSSPVDRRVMVSDQSPLRTDVLGVVGGPFGEQRNKVGMERDVAVVS